MRPRVASGIIEKQQLLEMSIAEKRDAFGHVMVQVPSLLHTCISVSWLRAGGRLAESKNDLHGIEHNLPSFHITIVQTQPLSFIYLDECPAAKLRKLACIGCVASDVHAMLILSCLAYAR